MTENKEYKLNVLINGERPDFRIFSIFLWGDDYNFDSDGDSYNPASRTWTWLYMASRVIKGQFFEITPISEDPLIVEVTSPNENITNRAALFLARETNGQIFNPDDAINSEHFTEKLGDDFDWDSALERADKSIWRQSTLLNPYPNIRQT